MAHPPSMARLALARAGHTVSDFSRWTKRDGAKGYHATYCRDVLALRYQPSEAFRCKLAEFLALDPDEIFSLEATEKAETATVSA